MTLAERIYQYLSENGPKSDAEIGEHLQAKLPSIRRARHGDSRIIANDPTPAVNKVNLWRVRTDQDVALPVPALVPPPSLRQARLELIREAHARLMEDE